MMRTSRTVIFGLVALTGCSLGLDFDPRQLQRATDGGSTGDAADAAHDAAPDVGGACATGRGDCDFIASNGCETDLTINPAHCGGCGRACNGSMTCNQGNCTSCRFPMEPCGTQCEDTTSDPRNCGACGRVCGTGSNRCCEGECRPRCG